MMGSPEMQSPVHFSPDQQGGPPLPSPDLQNPNAMMMYPQEGRALSKEINETRLEDLWPVAQRACAWMEGFKYGLTYEISPTKELSGSDYINLLDMFTTAESGSARPQPFYVGGAIEQSLQDGSYLAEIGAIKENRRLSTAEKTRLELVREIGNHMEARRLIDVAFRQRMAACAVEKDFSGLVGKDPSGNTAVTPDKGHWQAFFGSSETSPAHDWGESVDKTLRAIVMCGLSDQELATFKHDGVVSPRDRAIPQAIYADGFSNRKEFTNYISYLLEVSGGRIDVVWAAWRLALTWEEISELGSVVRVVPDKEIQGKTKTEMKIGAPPLVASLCQYTMHPWEKLSIEYGNTNGGQRTRDEKYISHSGLPWIALHIKEALGGENNIVGSFLHHATIDRVKRNPDGTAQTYPGIGTEKKESVSLYKIWAKDGVSFADPKFPWTQTDVVLTGDEVESGAFGTWRLAISRGSTAVELIKATPTVKEMATDPDFFSSGTRDLSNPLRSIDKLLKGRADDFRAHVVLGWLLATRDPSISPSSDIKEAEVRNYHTINSDLYWNTLPAGETENKFKDNSVYRILENAQLCGFITETTRKWITERLKIKESR